MFCDSSPNFGVWLLTRRLRTSLGSWWAWYPVTSSLSKLYVMVNLIAEDLDAMLIVVDSSLSASLTISSFFVIVETMRGHLSIIFHSWTILIIDCRINNLYILIIISITIIIIVRQLIHCWLLACETFGDQSPWTAYVVDSESHSEYDVQFPYTRTSKSKWNQPPKTGGSVKPVIWSMVQTLWTNMFQKGKAQSHIIGCRVALDCWSVVSQVRLVSFNIDVGCRLSAKVVGKSYLGIARWFCPCIPLLATTTIKSFVLVVGCFLLLVSSLFVHLLLYLRMAMSQYQPTKNWWMSFPAKTILYLFRLFTRGTTFWLHP